jgi:hypothetical protein
VLLRLTYLMVTNTFALLRLLQISDHEKEIEILPPAAGPATPVGFQKSASMFDLRCYAARLYSLIKPCAPRGALLYPRFSREELGGRFLGLMAYLDPKGEGDKSMPGKQCSCPGARGEALRDPRDMAKAGLPDIPISRRCKITSAGKTPETGATPCIGIGGWPTQPPECGAMPNEDIQGDEWDA